MIWHQVMEILHTTNMVCTCSLFSCQEVYRLYVDLKAAGLVWRCHWVAWLGDNSPLSWGSTFFVTGPVTMIVPRHTSKVCWLESICWLV